MGKRVFKYDKVLCRKFGKRLSDLRKDANITQEELAFQANYPPVILVQ